MRSAVVGQQSGGDKKKIYSQLDELDSWGDD